MKRTIFCAVIICCLAATARGVAVDRASESNAIFKVPRVNLPTSSAWHCSAPDKPTVTFNTSCTDANMHLRHCWLPSTGMPDFTSVLFPSGTNATAVFSGDIFSSIVVARNATLRIASDRGTSLAVTKCFFMYGVVHLGSTGDSGSMLSDRSYVKPTTELSAFPPDPNQPMGTDCPAVPGGFRPRICGPGLIVVNGTFYVDGMYSSVFASIDVNPSGKLDVNDGAFLWGNIFNSGFTAANSFYLHGSITNYNNFSLGNMWADRWSEGITVPKRKTIMIFNALGATFEIGGNGQTTGMHSTNSQTANQELPNQKYWEDHIKLVNNGTVHFDVASPGHQGHSAWYAGSHFDLFNYRNVVFKSANDSLGFRGTFYSMGSVVNAGNMTAVFAEINLEDYLSQGGKLISKQGGFFNFGYGSGIDTKTAETCNKQINKVTATPVRPRVVNTCPLASNVARNVSNGAGGCKSSSDCPQYSPCCWQGQCLSGCGFGYGPGNFCCDNGAGCSGSSHGPYCGNDRFSWEGLTQCNVDFVDRYDEASVKKHVVGALPRFGRHRYTFRGDSEVLGDGNGTSVVFSDVLEVRGTLRVGAGGVLHSVEDHKKSSIVSAGNGRLVIANGGRYMAGIRATYGNTTRITIGHGGIFYVQRYNIVDLHDSADLAVEDGGTLIVDGTLNVYSKGGQRRLRHCGVILGNGTIVGGSRLQC